MTAARKQYNNSHKVSRKAYDAFHSEALSAFYPIGCIFM